jgi:hypothetical protein
VPGPLQQRVLVCNARPNLAVMPWPRQCVAHHVRRWHPCRTSHEQSSSRIAALASQVERVPTSCHPKQIQQERDRSGAALRRAESAEFRRIRLERIEKDRTSLGSNPTVTAMKTPDHQGFSSCADHDLPTSAGPTRSATPQCQHIVQRCHAGRRSRSRGRCCRKESPRGRHGVAMLAPRAVAEQFSAVSCRRRSSGQACSTPRSRCARRIRCCR